MWIDVDPVIALLLFSKTEFETKLYILNLKIIIQIEIDFQSKFNHNSRQPTARFY